MAKKKLKTPFEEIKAEKTGSQRKTSPSEEAALVAMTAAGATYKQISEQLGRSSKWIADHKKRLRAEIAQYHNQILEDMEEDYTDVIALSLYRMRQQLTDDDFADEISIRDLAQVHKVVFNARQILRKEPTVIPGEAQASELQGKQLVDAIALRDEFNRNFETIQRAMIAKSADVELSDPEDVQEDN